jgi:hypothetical protein
MTSRELVELDGCIVDALGGDMAIQDVGHRGENPIDLLAEHHFGPPDVFRKGDKSPDLVVEADRAPSAGVTNCGNGGCVVGVQTVTIAEPDAVWAPRGEAPNIREGEAREFQDDTVGVDAGALRSRLHRDVDGRPDLSIS